MAVPLLLAAALAAVPAAGSREAPADPAAAVLDAERAVRAALAAGAPREEVSRVAAGFVDYDEVARRSVGKRWARLSAGDRRAVVEALRALLEEKYLPRGAPAPGAAVTATVVRRRGGEASVHAVSTSGAMQAPIELDLRRGADGRWRVCDAVVSGLAIVEGYREQLPQLLALGGVPRLVAQLRAEREAEAARHAVAAPAGAPTVRRSRAPGP